LLAFSSANYSVAVTVRQVGDFTEPTEVRITTGQDGSGETYRVPVGLPNRIDLAGASVTPLGDGRWRIELSPNERPEQVVLDPDRIPLDRNPGDNRWKTEFRTQITPLYTFANETDVTSDFDRWTLTGGPWLWGPSYQDPWYTRSTMLGLRAGANRPQKYRVG